jgi:hypothetical protein
MRIYPRFFPFFLLLLSACAAVGLQPAQSFGDKLAYAYGVHTAVLNASAVAVGNKSLSVPDGRTVLQLADQSRALLEEAKTLSGTNITAAGDKLILATAILTQLQTFLNARGKHP